LRRLEIRRSVAFGRIVSSWLCLGCEAMRARLTAVSLACLAAALVIVAGAGAAMVGIYRNGMETAAQREQMVKLSGRNCRSGAGQRALVITLGKFTNQCSYRTPVVGRDLEVSAGERLLSETPKKLQRQVFVGLFVRTGGGGGYQLLLYPSQQKVQLRKNLPGGKVKYLAIVRGLRAVEGQNGTNQLGLQAIDITSGPERGQCHLFAYVGGKLAAEAIDPGARELSGSAAGVAVGSANVATGAAAAVENVVVRVPSPY